MPKYRCPKCRSRALRVVVKCWADVLQDDRNLMTDIDPSNQEWDQDSPMSCCACSHRGFVAHFTVPDPVTIAQVAAFKEALQQLCQAHGLCLGPEGGNAASIVRYNPDNWYWAQQACLVKELS
jgi:DNA-directed RNA polymerase subunit RPC12/RpoP